MKKNLILSSVMLLLLMACSNSNKIGVVCDQVGNVTKCINNTPQAQEPYVKEALVNEDNAGDITPQQVEEKIKQGANVNGKGEDGTSLRVATLYRRPDIVAILIKHGANLNTIHMTNRKGRTILETAVMRESDSHTNYPIVKLLLKNGADVNAKLDVHDSTLLLYAMPYMQPNMLKLLLKYGGNVNSKNSYGMTPLLAAPSTDRGNSELVSILLNYNANIHVEDRKGYTPLMLSIMYNVNYTTIARLIKMGANVNAKNIYGETPLIMSIHNYDTNIAELLLSKGTDIHAKDSKGYTALGRAVDNEYGNSEIIEVLLKHGANINDTTNGYSLISSALHRHNLEPLKILLKHGLRPTKQDLEYADSEKNFIGDEVLELLKPYRK